MIDAGLISICGLKAASMASKIKFDLIIQICNFKDHGVHVYVTSEGDLSDLGSLYMTMEVISDLKF